MSILARCATIEFHFENVWALHVGCLGNCLITPSLCCPLVAAPATGQQRPGPVVGTYMVVSLCRSTEMVWQVECSSTRAVDSVASFTTPM